MLPPTDTETAEVGKTLMQLAAECRTDQRTFYLRIAKERRQRISEYNSWLNQVDEMIRKEEAREGQPMKLYILRNLVKFLYWTIVAEETEKRFGVEAREWVEHLMAERIIRNIDHPPTEYLRRLSRFRGLL